LFAGQAVPSVYAENVLAARVFQSRQEWSRIDKPVDRDEWEVTPQTVNAYYKESRNEIVFPVAIWQPPFFDPQADDAVNYGAIGMIIGHEMTHGFDDRGRRFDAGGNLRDWWARSNPFTSGSERTLWSLMNAFSFLPQALLAIS
jgi:putative endopeptidase